MCLKVWPCLSKSHLKTLQNKKLAHDSKNHGHKKEMADIGVNFVTHFSALCVMFATGKGKLTGES
jgi:hypothetical protein